MIGFSPLPWGEGGESSEPGEGFLLTEPRNFGIRVEKMQHWEHAIKYHLRTGKLVSAAAWE